MLLSVNFLVPQYTGIVRCFVVAPFVLTFRQVRQNRLIVYTAANETVANQHSYLFSNGMFLPCMNVV
jgi:hypothetical protein